MRKILSLVIVIALVLGGVPMSVVASGTGNSVPSPSSLSSQLFVSITQKEHPYIAYEESEIPALKAKTASGYSKKAYDCIKETANKYLSAQTPMSGGIAGRQLQSYVAFLSMYSALSDDDKYAEKAVVLVTDAASKGSTDIYYGINDALAVADFGYAYALAYDWLYDYMTVEQRNLVKEEMISVGEWLYNDSGSNNTWGADNINRMAWNWNAVCHGALGMISISLGEHREWLTKAIERIQGYYAYSVDSTGAGVEGLHYIGYGMNYAIPLDYMIYRTTGIELMDYYPNVQKVPEWSMRMNAPFGNEQASIGQGTKLDNHASTFYIISRYSQRTELWGWERTYALENGGGFASEYAGNGFSAPWVILFEDKTLLPQEPNESMPLIKTYEKGIVIAKDSWEKDASMLTFTSGWGRSGCWNHPDDNTFTFFAKGESFVIDLGAGYKKSSEHNLVSVDGNGMFYEAGGTMIEGHILKNTTLKNGALYLKGDHSDSYKDNVLTKSVRQIIYMGGDTPYVIAFDYAVSSGSDHEFTTNFYTDVASNVKIDGDHATITGGNAGGIGHTYAYSTGKTSLSLTKTDKTQAITVTNQADVHCAATVFITDNYDGTTPSVTFGKSNNGTITVTLNYTTSKGICTDKYILSDSSDVPFTQSFIEEIYTENAPDDDNTSSGNSSEVIDKEKTSKNTMICAIVAGGTLILGAVVTSVFVLCKKRKHRKNS